MAVSGAGNSRTEAMRQIGKEEILAVQRLKTKYLEEYRLQEDREWKTADWERV